VLGRIDPAHCDCKRNELTRELLQREYKAGSDRSTSAETTPGSKESVTYKYTKNMCSLSLPDRRGLGLSSAEVIEARESVAETSTRWYRRNKVWLEVLSNS